MIMLLCTAPCDDFDQCNENQRPVPMSPSMGPSVTQLLMGFVDWAHAPATTPAHGASRLLESNVKPYTARLCTEILSRIIMFGDENKFSCSFCGGRDDRCSAEESCPRVPRLQHLTMLLGAEIDQHSVDYDSIACTASTVTSLSIDSRFEMNRGEVLRKVFVRLKSVYAAMINHHCWTASPELPQLIELLAKQRAVEAVLRCTKSYSRGTIATALGILHHLCAAISLPAHAFRRKSLLQAIIASNGSYFFSELLHDAGTQLPDKLLSV